MVKKKVCIPRSFLVINVCNQGKTLSSPCILRQVKFKTILLYKKENMYTFWNGSIPAGVIENFH